MRGLPADQALIDGEAVVLRKDGRSDFGALLTKRGGAEATLMAFDLVRLDGDDLRLKPLEARREALRRLVAGVNGILFSEALASEGAVVFAKACELDLEGIVSKREGSFYRCGRSRNWLKAKNPDFVRTGPPCLEGTARDFLPPRLCIASAAVMPTKKISREQLRDALALIGMKHEELAEAARVSPAAIAEFERGERVLHERTFVAVIEALEARGVEFSDGGVKMR